MSQNAAKMGQNAAGKMKPFVDRNFGFGMKALRKYPELLPLTIMCGIGYAVGFAYMGFGLVAKADVRINPWEKVARSERTEVSNTTKVYDNVKHGSIPELDALRREMGLHENK